MMLNMLIAQFDPVPLILLACGAAAAVAVLIGVPLLLGIRYIPNHCAGIVEMLWSSRGSVAEGRMIALDGEAGYQADLLRGGLHFFYWRWQYRIHKVPLTIIPQGQIGYVFARDGEPLRPEQTLARVVDCNDFQDAYGFLAGGDEKSLTGQRGRQRAILREGVYAINLALFVVITADRVNRLDMGARGEGELLSTWRKELGQAGGFQPVVIGRERAALRRDLGEDAGDVVFPDETTSDCIGIVTVHDGPTLGPGQIIAPPVGASANEPDYHSNFQDIEAFLRVGGRRGRQFLTLTDGTYFINRWFATVEVIPKTIVPIGHVGVVVSYFGSEGHDLSGDAFRHGERVGEGERGVQAKTLGPGKYAFNTFAGRVHLVPTTNFVLHWITGRTEVHKFDESLKSIDLVTADAYEPVLPLSVVVHLDYQKAAGVVQRFGDVKKLITQTLDPLLSAYFRDIAHKKTMLQLLHERDAIQAEAREELRRRFAEFDIELVDVLIGKPDPEEAGGDIETLLEQLRTRQLSREQIQTYQQQSAAAEKLKELKMAQALAEMQTELTNSQVEIEIVHNRGQADLAMAKKKAEQSVVLAEAEHQRTLLAARAEAKSKSLLGQGESRRVSLEGAAEARVLEQKVASYGDPRLYALSLVAQHLSASRQPLVPRHLFVGAGGDNGRPATEQGLLGTLLQLLVAEKSGFAENGKPAAMAAERPHVDARAPANEA